MNKRRIISTSIIISIIIIGGIIFYWYTQRQITKESSKLQFGKTSIGYVQWPGYLGLYIAGEKGYFKEAGLDVDLKGYSSLSEQYNNYISGKDQGTANLTLDAINDAYDGLDHKIVLAIDHSNGSDGIIAAKKIKGFADVKGKRVAFEHGTLEEFFLRHALEQYFISFKDIIPINLDPEISAQAVVDGTADVAVTYEPFMSKALAESGGHKIYSSADAPGLITDVLTFRSDFIHEHPEAIEAIIRAYFRGIRFWKEHPEEANVIIAKYLNIPVDQVPAQVGGVIILDEADNRTAFTFAAGLESLYGNTRSIGEFVRKQRPQGGAQKVDTDVLIEPRFIRDLFK